MFDIPIAVIFFNRPEKLRETFEQVKKIKPKKLFLIQDGPRGKNENDKIKVEECRRIVEDIQWDCDVKRNYSEKNLGCGERPASGIIWAFTMVDKLIILEDDCVVNQSFFTFCEKMLKKYDENEKIMLISGMNLLNEYQSDYSYIFSKACTIGAWATWKRVWDKYDFEIKSFDNKAIRKKLKKEIVFKNIIKQKFCAWNLTREKIKHNERINWWDYQFHYLLYLNSGLGIVPTKNLVENIGYGEDATNVSNKDDAIHFNLKTHTLPEKLTHPPKIEWETKYDEQVHKIQKIKVSSIRVFLGKIKRTLIRIIRR